ncbi:MAG: hypothetical protein HC933_09960 [Pleurocapsa sp. SU_196_0]|nr:hypothetical protein [Pleurocapsa sp. SU_196_0]
MKPSPLGAFFVASSVAVIAAACAQAQQPAAAWKIETVKTGLERPWSINFAPDGRLFYTTRYTGELQALNVKERRGAAVPDEVARPSTRG